LIPVTVKVCAAVTFDAVKLQIATVPAVIAAAVMIYPVGNPPSITELALLQLVIFTPLAGFKLRTE
jgi:hypothetical protein